MAELDTAGATRTAVRTLRRRAERARFAVWARRLDLRLRRNGSRLILDCPDGGRFVSPPRVEVPLRGPRPGSLTLRLAPGASLGRELILEVTAGGDSVLELGRDTWLGAWCRLQLHGGAIRVGPEAQIRDGAQLKSRGLISVGERTILSVGAIVHADERVSIGAHVAVGERTSLIDTDHEVDGSGGSVWEARVRAAPIELADGVLVGASSVILCGTTLGAGTVVGAGAVVVGGEHPPGSRLAGVPARARPRSRE
ncbi:MAG TPA: hypothetical protein VHX88_02960 [Solirubrobacteraceae bacterium]|nr:hypothetical protein [Solirubrobacteraceae bacterium]